MASHTLLVCLATAIAAVAGTRLVRAYAERTEILDIPNIRSSHTEPTPRGGGVIVALTWMAGTAWFMATDQVPVATSLALLGGGFLIALTGWWDDRRNLPRKIRFTLQLGAAFWTVLLLGGLDTVQLPPWTVSLGTLGSALAVLGVVWMINLYNFMDGIDGLAGIEALTSALFIGIVFQTAGREELALLSWVLGAASLGFLVWNWPPASIFMGDVGSGLLGYAFAALALVAETTAGIPLVVVLVPLGVFIVDATYTLFRRLLKGETVYKAHRSHVYQRLVRGGWTHRQVDITVFGLNILLCVIAWEIWIRPDLALPAVLGALVLVMVAGATAIHMTPGLDGLEPSDSTRDA